MSKASPVWVWTPHFTRAMAAAGLKPDPDIRIIHFDPADPGEMLSTFRRIRENEGARPVFIFDVARFPDETEWAYVADGVNRSGANPLRGLGAVMREPFIDVSRLYHVPEGQAGVEAVFLGERYQESVSDLSGPGAAPVVCGHLHNAAILAHAEGLTVTGVLVAEAYAASFDFRQVRMG